MCQLIDETSLIIDWKVGDAIRREDLLQIVAYKVAYEHTTNKKIDKCYIVRLDNRTGKYELKTIKDEKRMFTLFLYAYGISHICKI